MKTTHLFSLLLLLPTLIISQTEEFSNVYNGYSNAYEWDHNKRDALLSLRYNINRVFDDYKTTQIIGNAYYNKNFILGEVAYNNQVIPRKFALRYNAFTDEIEVRTDTSFVYLVKEPTTTCIIGTQKYIYHSYGSKAHKNIKIGYLKIVYEGKEHTLLVRKTKRYKKEKKAKTTLTASYPAKLVDSEKFYILKPEKTAVFLKQKKKALLAVIPQKYQQQMEAFFKKNRLNPKKQQT